MLDADTLKVAIVLINRAPLKGDEATNVAVALQKLQAAYEVATAPPIPVMPEEPQDIT